MSNKRKPKTIDDLENEMVANIMKVLNHESPIACVLIATSFLENAVKTLLYSYLLKSEITDNMFKVNGQLDSFSKCYQMAYSLGILGKTAFKNLGIIGGIRNTFAHRTEFIDFDHPEVIRECGRLIPPQILKNEFDKSDRREKFCQVAMFLLTDMLVTVKQMKGPKKTGRVLFRCEEYGGSPFWEIPYVEDRGRSEKMK